MKELHNQHEGTMKKQKEMFLEDEGDNWFERNSEEEATHEIEIKLLPYLQRINPRQLLEIGCGTGVRLDFLSKHMPNCSFWGVDPAQKATEHEHATYSVLRATADELPFENSQFDIVLVGFCLTYCDVEDFFKIASEIDRVLNDKGMLVIIDFEPPFEYQNPYAYREGMWTTKMQFRNMFCWHPSYTLSEVFPFSHESDHFHPDPNERLSVSIIHKLPGVNVLTPPYQPAI